MCKLYLDYTFLTATNHKLTLGDALGDRNYAKTPKMHNNYNICTHIINGNKIIGYFER